MSKQRSAPQLPAYPSLMLPKSKFNSLQDLKSNIMQQKLKQKLWAHTLLINPELLRELEESEILNEYLDEKIHDVLPLLDQLSAEQKPEYVIEELCLKALTADIRPSAFQYNLSVLEREFAETHRIWEQNGMLTQEIINFHRYCRGKYRQQPLVANSAEDDETYKAVTGRIREYLWEQTLADLEGSSFPD